MQLLLWWFGTFFVFLSIAETKRQLYMLPAFPAFALIMGPWLAAVTGPTRQDDSPEQVAPRQRPVHIYAVVICAVFLALGVFVVLFAAAINRIIPRLDLDVSALAVANLLQMPLLLLGIVMAAGGVWIGLSWRKRHTLAALGRIGLTYAALYVTIFGIVMPNFAPSKTYKPQGEWIRQQIGATQTHIGMVYPGGGGIRKRGAFGFETGGVMVDLLETEQQVEAFFDEYPDSLVLVEGHSRDTIFGDNQRAWETRTVTELRVGRTLYIVVRDQGSGQEP
jgi:hypothetical protein